jgi:SAM-dependent methyltransferase
MRVTACLRATDGTALAAAAHRWLGPLTAGDDTVLARAVPPVLDVGCGPGRHVLALAERGVVALGIDITPAALDVARRRGAPVLARSVFERVPAAGRWACALLLDGNLGIGGDPAALLARVASLLRPAGMLLVELAPARRRAGPEVVRLDIDGADSPWFAWTSVDASDLPMYALVAGLRMEDVWHAGARSFGSLRRA